MTVAPPMVGSSSSPEETRALGARLGGLIVAGDVVLLGGDLGAGKTTFTQGLASALGVVDPVTSPTFTLLHSHDGLKLRLLHADVYRLEHLHEILDLALPELLDEGAVAVIEWGEFAAPALLPDYLRIRIDFGRDERGRILELHPVGAGWGARQRQLSALFGAGPGPSGPALPAVGTGPGGSS